MQAKDITDFSFKDVVAYIKKYWLWIVLAAFSAALGTYVQFHDSSKFVSSARFSILKSETSHIQQVTNQLSGAGGYSDPSDNLVKKYMLFFGSKELSQKVFEQIEKLGMQDLIPNLVGNPNSFKQRVSNKLGIDKWLIRFGLHSRRLTKEKILSNPNLMMSLINGAITANRNESNVITITTRSNDPKTGVVLANLAMDVAILEVTKSDLLEVKESQKFLTKQIDDVKNRVTEIETYLTRVKQKNQGGDAARREAQRHLSQLKNQLIEARSNKGQIDELINRLMASQKIDYANRNKLAKLQRESFYWKSKTSALNKMINQMKAAVPKGNDKHFGLLQTIQNLIRQKEFQYAHLESLQTLSLQLNVKEISIKSKTSVIERASMRRVLQSKLPKEGILASMLLAACFVIFFFFIKESLSPEIRSKDDLVNFDILNFGIVPDLTISTNLNRLARRINLKTDVPEEIRESPLYIPPDSPQAFVFGAIRSKIFHNIESAEAEHKIISITSPRQGEGKSMITGKLASSLALTGKKVLLIDGDLISKEITHQMHLDEHKGLKEVLYQGAKIEDVVTTSPIFENLDVLSAGTGRGSIADILLTRASSHMFSECREKWDIVIIDTPALLVAPDALLTCRYSDITALILSINNTKVSDVSMAYNELTDNGVENIGYILNKSGNLLKYVYYQPTRRSKKAPPPLNKKVS